MDNFSQTYFDGNFNIRDMVSKLETPGIQELCVAQRTYEFVKLNFGTFFHHQSGQERPSME